MPDYDKALEDLKKKTLEQAKEKDKDEEMD